MKIINGVMKFFAVIVIACSFLFCSCSVPTKPSESDLYYSMAAFNKEVFAKKGQCVTVLSAKNDLASSSFDAYVTKCVLRNKNGKKMTVYFSGEYQTYAYKNRNGYYDYVLMLMPGKYSISEIELYASNGSMYSVLKIKTASDIYFEANPGELLYAGCLDIQTKNEKRQNKKWYESKYKDSYVPYFVKIEDKSEETKELIDLYESLTGVKSTTRLMRYSNPDKSSSAAEVSK